MTTENLTEYLENAWDDGGFLDAVRRGQFVEKDSLSFIAALRSASIEEQTISKRLVSLLWYLPSFLDWQKARVAENGGDVESYQRFTTEVHNALEELLGVP
jgi:hypothetical protein